MKLYHGNYNGIVVDNADPERRGRIKVFVPHISCTLYDGWNNTIKDKEFKYIGANIDSDLDLNILKELKQILPWSEYCAPIMGEHGPQRYNYTEHYTSPSKSNNLDGFVAANEDYEYHLNDERIGENASKLYEKYPIEDDFKDCNPYFKQYKPESYSNSPSGVFGIPNVGSHVWVFFREGNPNYPVYFGGCFSKSDFHSIYGELVEDDSVFPDYPASFENAQSSNGNPIYRNKFLLNQKGGNILINNTDKKEKIKLTHYSGSFLEFNNKTTTIFNSSNYQSFTNSNWFSTVKGELKQASSGISEYSSLQNFIIRVGNNKIDPQIDWFNVYKDIYSKLKQYPVNSSDITSAITSKIQQLTAIEETLGKGGSFISTISKNYTNTIGLKFFNILGYNIIPSIDNTLVKIQINGNTSTITEDYIDRVDPIFSPTIPFGNKLEKIGHSYRLMIGSGGYDLKTSGNININGGIIDQRSSSTYISSKISTQIAGNEKLLLAGKRVIIKHNGDDGQVLMDRNLGVLNDLDVGNDIRIKNDAIIGNDLTVLNNVIINGTLHVDGMATSDTDFVTNGISLKTHIHSGVISGGDITGLPQ